MTPDPFIQPPLLTPPALGPHFLLIFIAFLHFLNSMQVDLHCASVISDTLFLFIRTSKSCLRLAVLTFFFVFEAEMFLICSYFGDWTLQCHKEECQTEYNKSTLFHFFCSFSFKPCTMAATGRCSTKKPFCNCAKTNHKIPKNEFNFSLRLHASSVQLY